MSQPTEQSTEAPAVEGAVASQTAGILRFVTCGSVDDGKSTLIGRLLYESKSVFEDQLSSVVTASKTVGTTGDEVDLALLTDGLKAEREQGITIDVAYRYFATPKRKFIVADCPGHEQYTRNMATGASTANLAILLVDARKGVITQTRRHSFIASLLGIKHVVVAVNKMDLVDYSESVFRRICDEFNQFSERLGFPDVTAIPVSALKGENITTRTDKMPWYGGITLLEHLENVQVGSDQNLIDARFPVQLVCRPHLDFRGFQGTVASGILRQGEEVLALPSGSRSRIRSILGPDGDSIPQARPPMAITVTLEDEIDVSRGDMLVPINNVPRVGTRCEAMLVWMSTEPMEPGKDYVIKHCTRLLPAQIATLRYRVDVNTLRHHDAEQLALNEIGRIELVTGKPMAFDPYRQNRNTGAFIVIDRRTHATVGAGMIVDRATEWSSGLYPRPQPESTKTPDRQWQKSQVSTAERRKRLGHRPFCVWLTGLKGSGKTTIAHALERALFDAGVLGRVVDGRELRSTLSSDLNYTGDDRRENIRRASEVARLLTDAGIVAICSMITPFEADRRSARRVLNEVVGKEGFIEVYLSTSRDVCRDRTGQTYDQAESGEIAGFTGVTAPFEPPEEADLTFDTGSMSVEDCVKSILAELGTRDLLPTQ